jgi:hypothetical protein
LWLRERFLERSDLLWSFAPRRKRLPKSKKISRSWFGVFIARCPWRKLHGHSCFTPKSPLARSVVNAVAQRLLTFWCACSGMSLYFEDNFSTERVFNE